MDNSLHGAHSVERVEALLSLADQIEARYTKAKSHIDKLTQSILAKAFRGELVPQDPNNPPASELLERIRAERVNSESQKTDVMKKGLPARKAVRQAKRKLHS